MFGHYLKRPFLSVPFMGKCQHYDYRFSTINLLYKADIQAQ